MQPAPLTGTETLVPVYVLYIIETHSIPLTGTEKQETACRLLIIPALNPLLAARARYQAQEKAAAHQRGWLYFSLSLFLTASLILSALAGVFSEILSSS